MMCTQAETSVAKVSRNGTSRVLVPLLSTVIMLGGAEAEGQGPEGLPPRFIRGDASGNGFVGVNDPIIILRYLFRASQVPLEPLTSCEDALDADDSGKIEVTDAIYLLNHLFLGGPPPPHPYPICGEDPTLDGLGCVGYEFCPQPTSDFTNSIGMRFIFVPPGTFLMGSPADERGRELVCFLGRTHQPRHELQHRVRLSCGFYMGVYEVTQGEYLRVMGHNPSVLRPGTPYDVNRAVNNLTWYDAVAFCRRLSQLEGYPPEIEHYRLPTEAEWEYACRAGTTTRFSFGDALECNDDAPMEPCPTVARFVWQIADPDPAVVGVKLPNPWGLHDMHGNVGEWVQDWYAPYPEHDVTDPSGPRTGTRKVIRGEGKICFSYCRSAGRAPAEPSITSTVGFRVAFAGCPRRPGELTR
jgi:formylglycine-generating enzyme required for sulfatase activity